MKKFKLIIVPSTDSERTFEQEDIKTFEQAEKLIESDTDLNDCHEYSFKTEQERNLFLQGYAAGIGYLGEGLHFTKDID